MNGRRRCQVRPRRAEEGAAVERPWSPWNVERMRHRCSVCFPRVKQKCQKRGLIQPRDPNSFLVGLRTSKRSYLKFVSLLFRCLFWGFLSLGDLLGGVARGAGRSALKVTLFSTEAISQLKFPSPLTSAGARGSDRRVNRCRHCR